MARRSLSAHAAFAEAATADRQGLVEVDGPKWGKLRRAWLAKNTAETTRDAGLRGYDVLDIAGHDEASGGSGGLAELQVLARS